MSRSEVPQALSLLDRAKEIVPSQYALDFKTSTISSAPSFSCIRPRDLSELHGFLFREEKTVGKQARTAFNVRTAIVSPDGRKHTVFYVPVDTTNGYSSLELQPDRFILNSNGELCEVVGRENVHDVLGYGLWEDVTFRDPAGNMHSARIGPTMSSSRPISSIVVGFVNE